MAAELAAGGDAIDCFEVNAAELTVERIQNLTSTLTSLDRQIVIVIDEADHLGGPPTGRLAAAQEPGRRETLVALLSALDGLRPIDNVFWILATSAPAAIDPSLRRPGRIDLTIELDLPTDDDRAELIGYFLRGVIVEAGFDLGAAAAAIGLATPATIRSLLGDAYAFALDEGSAELGQRHLHHALDRSGRRARDPEADPAALRRIAIHEAGHALVATILGESPTQIRLQQESGMTSYEERYRKRLQAGVPDRAVLDRIATALAGTVAEHVLLGEGSLGSESDLVAASTLARQRLASACDPSRLARPGTDLPPFFAGMSGGGDLDAIEPVLQAEWSRTKGIVEGAIAGIEYIAATLIAERHLSGDRLATVLATAHALTRGEEATAA
jgi:ATP-dependent Zn protease